MMPEPSYYQQLFLRRIKREKQLIVLWRTAVFLLFLLIGKNPVIFSEA